MKIGRSAKAAAEETRVTSRPTDRIVREEEGGEGPGDVQTLLFYGRNPVSIPTRPVATLFHGAEHVIVLCYSVLLRQGRL